MALTQVLKSEKARKATVTIPLRIRKQTAQNLDYLVRRLHARSRNEIIRDAIEQYTAQMMKTKIIEQRELSTDEAVKLIDKYISENPGRHYVSEISEALGIELDTAFKATQKLLESGQARRRN